MAISAGVRRAMRLGLVPAFACGINGLASGCHGSLDLLVDHGDAAVTLAPKDAGSDGADSGRPHRVPPIPCKQNDECRAVGGVCVTDKGICGECTGDGSCSGQRPKCDVATNECVGCLDAGDCPNGWTCDQAIRMCAVACSSNNDCGSPLYRICSPSRHVCTQCEYDSDCQFALTMGLSLRCRAGLCNECVSDSDCPPDRKSCDLRFGFCEGCRTSDQCPAGSSCTPVIPNTDFFRQCQPTQ